MNLNWGNIRIHNNSQNNGFEELVCQLARGMKLEKQTSFYRLGTPDGGVECYWELEDDKEVGWQAKYVFSVENLIPQVDRSIKTAVKNHEKMTTYIVAIPFNLPDPHYERGGKPIKSAKTKWNERVKKWETEYSNEEKKFKVELWDESKLNELLILPQYEGLRYYWFNGNELTFKSFSTNLDAAVSDLGPRYTSELNVELELSSVFDYLLRNKRSIKGIQKYYYSFKISLENTIEICLNFKKSIDLSDEIAHLIDIQNHMEKLLKMASFSEMQSIDCFKIVSYFSEIEKIIHSIWTKIDDYFIDKELKVSNYRTKLNDLLLIIEEGNSLFSRNITLSENPFMILHGEPGIGKSHLLADICLKQKERGVPAILLLGEQFSKNIDPRETIKQSLQYSGTFSSLLQMLNSIGQVHMQRVLLVIDALNEGEGTFIWQKYLAGLESEIRDYPWIGFVVSLRTDYMEEILPEKSKETMVLIEHTGFDENYDFACEHFFEYYNLDIRVPIFNMEFNNPLFLKLFCESCENTMEAQELPSFPKIIEQYINHINEKLYRKFRYEKSLDLVNTATELIAQTLAIKNSYAIPYSELKELLDSEISKNLGNNSPSEYFNFLDALIKEGVFRTFSDFRRTEKNVSFAYDKMRDYKILLYWLEQNSLNETIPDYIAALPFFQDMFQEKNYGYNTKLELLAIILPEKYGIEIVECVPDGKVTYQILKSFLKSFQWRTKINKAIKIGKWLNDISEDNIELKLTIIDSLLSVAPVYNHPFNIEFIVESFLDRKSMSELDAWWTPHLNKKYDDYNFNIYKRIVKWCWRIERKFPLETKTRYLLGLTLSYFLSSSNRNFRDSATKGLTCIYLGHSDEFIDLMERMKNTKDEYILERIYAAAFGAIVYDKKNDQIKKLANFVINNFFNKSNVYPNILIRDYARGIVEYAINCKVYETDEIEDIKARITPPYKSAMPSEFPTNEDIQLLKSKYDKAYGFYNITSSMDTGQSYGDFGRYTFKNSLNEFLGIEEIIKKLENWSIMEIIRMGYDPSMHDSDKIPYRGRSVNRIERVGKKYQWIVFHKLLALVADNYKLKDEDWWPEKNTRLYSGAWQLSVRDIDPTLLIQGKKGLRFRQPSRAWYSDFDYLSVFSSGEDWIKEELDIGENLLLMQDPEGNEWITLCYYPHWNEYPADYIEDKKVDKKTMRAYIYSYITENKRGHDCEVEKAAELSGHDVFIGEYYWAKSFEENCLFEVEDWEEVKTTNGKTIKIKQTTQRYAWDKETDYSKEDSIAFDIPTKFIIESMGLNSSVRPGYYYMNDELVCINPSIDNEANHQLLIRKDIMCKWLHENNFKLHWKVTVEKYLSSGMTHNTKKWSDYLGWFYLDRGEIIGDIKNTDGSELRKEREGSS